MHSNDLKIIKPALIAKKEALQNNEVEEVYSYLYRHVKEWASEEDPDRACAKLTAFFNEQRIDPFFYLTDTIPEGMYGESYAKISDRLLSSNGTLSFKGTSIIRILEGSFINQYDIVVADLSNIIVCTSWAFWKCDALREVIIDANTMEYSPGSIKHWGRNIQTLKVKNLNMQCSDSLEELLWETDTNTSINVEKI